MQPVRFGSSRRWLVVAGAIVVLAGAGLVVTASTASTVPERDDGSGSCLEGTRTVSSRSGDGRVAVEAVRTALYDAWMSSDRANRCLAEDVALPAAFAPSGTGPVASGGSDNDGGGGGTVVITRPPRPHDGRAGVVVVQEGNYYEFTVEIAGDPQVLGIERFTPAMDQRQARAALDTYLQALATGDVATASSLLTPGDEPHRERDDLRPLDLPDDAPPRLAVALAEYCAGTCPAPTAVTVDGLDRRSGFQAAASFGGVGTVPFTVWVTEGDGQTYVRGLPPAGP